MITHFKYTLHKTHTLTWNSSLCINKPSKRAMHRVGTQFLEIGRNQLNNVVRASMPQQRNLRILAGKLKDKQASTIMPSIYNENPEQVQADQTGFHKVVVVESCRENQCHKRECDTVHERICHLKNADTVGVTELEGTLTHP